MRINSLIEEQDLTAEPPPIAPVATEQTTWPPDYTKYPWSELRRTQAAVWYIAHKSTASPEEVSNLVAEAFEGEDPPAINPLDPSPELLLRIARRTLLAAMYGDAVPETAVRACAVVMEAFRS